MSIFGKIVFSLLRPVFDLLLYFLFVTVSAYLWLVRPVLHIKVFLPQLCDPRPKELLHHLHIELCIHVQVLEVDVALLVLRVLAVVVETPA